MLQKTGITRAFPKWTSNFCYEHIPKRALPAEPTAEEIEAAKEKFGVQMIEVDEIEVCPRCKCEEDTKRLEDEASAQYNHTRLHEKERIFENQSVFTDRTLEDASFETYVLNDDEHEARTNKQHALQMVELYAQGHRKNLWITGNVGVGKSHIAMSILRELNGIHCSCAFIELDEMFRLINDSMFHNKESTYTEKYFIDLATSVDFLVLDDLGAETGDVDTMKRATDYKNKTLRAILNGRQDKSTIFTTNLSYNQVISMYDAKLVDRALKKQNIIKFTNTLSFRTHERAPQEPLF